MNNASRFCLRCGDSIKSYLKWQQVWQLKTINWPVCCQKCWYQFEPCQVEGSCQYCQHPLKDDVMAICADCQHWLTIYDAKYLSHQSLFQYNSAFKEWIRDYKYLGDIRQAQLMVPIIQKYYQKYSHYRWTFLPSSPQNLTKRGFNQIEILLELAQIPYQPLFYYVEKASQQSQAQKNKTQRQNLEQPFQLIDTEIANQDILILDDVYTTGTTLLKAKELLFEQPIHHCHSLTLARDILV